MDRAAHWLANGAQASDGAIRILQRAKLIDENGKAIPYTPADAAVGAAGAAA